MPTPAEVQEKSCSKCGEVKPFTSAILYLEREGE